MSETKQWLQLHQISLFIQRYFYCQLYLYIFNQLLAVRERCFQAKVKAIINLEIIKNKQIENYANGRLKTTTGLLYLHLILNDDAELNLIKDFGR